MADPLNKGLYISIRPGDPIDCHSIISTFFPSLKLIKGSFHEDAFSDTEEDVKMIPVKNLAKNLSNMFEEC